MKCISFILFLFTFLGHAFGQNYFSVGTWRDHLPYARVNEIAVVNQTYYAATPFSLIAFDNVTNEITRYSTVNGLSEVGISGIVANESQNTLLITYESSNIDLLIDDDIINLSAILNSNIIGDKTIYELVSHNRYVYICTGFGIVVIDLNKKEVKDTYILGDNNTQVKVSDLHISNDSIFALTDFGIKAAVLSSNFLSDANSWGNISPPPFVVGDFESYGEDFLAYGTSNIILKYNQSNWDTLLFDPSQEITNARFNNQKLAICTPSYLTVYDQNIDTIDFIYAYNGQTGILPNDVINQDDYYWVADNNEGFLRLKNNFNAETIGKEGPYTNEAFHLASSNENLYISSGRTDGTNWNKTYNWHGIYKYDQSSWKMYNQITVQQMSLDIDTVSDIVWTTPDPSNIDKFFASSFGGGVLMFEGDELVDRFTFHNSSLQTRMGQSGNNVYVAGSAFDNGENLWVSNSFTNSPLSVYTKEGEWKSFYCGSLAVDQLCTDLVFDHVYGYIWMVIKGVGVLVYDYNQTPLDETDDEYKIIGTGSGSGSLPSSYVNCLAIDLDGEIWIGTDKGPVVFYSSYPIFNESSFDAQRILLELDGTLQYLLENEIITDVVVDGANRKWIATSGGGLFLMSADGTETIHSFSETNSPLYSDNITSLAINNSTGELYIATEEGVLGFRSTATASNINFTKLEVFPNPVRPDYYGAIAIKGMMNNAEVKITNSNGLLVKTIIADGGQAVWEGMNENNEQVSSGVYYIFSSSSDGYSKAKTKVLIIR